MNVLSLFALFLSIISISWARKIPTNSQEHHDGVLLNINDFLNQFKRDKNNKIALEVDGTSLNLEYYGPKSKVPVLVFDDNGRTELDHDSIHDLYHDKQKNATFTISTFKRGDKQVRSVRGSVLLDNSEIIVDPVFPKFKKPKRNVNSIEDQYGTHVKIFRRQLTGRPDLRPQVDNHVKTKRQTGTLNAYVETLAICDYFCYNQHSSYMGSLDKNTIAHHIEGYLAHIMNLADLHYQRSFENDVQLKIGLYTNTYIILTTSEASKFTTNPSHLMTLNSVNKDSINRLYVNGDTSLRALNEWLMDQVAGSTIPSFDIAVCFTNANLLSNSDLLGIAPMSGACDLGRNGVLVEDSGSFASGGTTAHEIAHNLGVQHDQDMKDSACTDEMNYLMSTSNKMTNRINSYYLSSCSIRALKTNFLVEKKFDCTYNKIGKAADYNKFISFKPGQLYNANEQCKQQYGSNAKIMTGSKSGGGTFEEDMCKNLWCTTDYRSAQTGSAAAEGTSCGNGKWCIKGVCEVDSKAPTGTCLTEDDTVFCNDFLNKYGMSNVCLNYKNGSCCKMCGGTLIPKLYDIQTWLSGNTLDNIKFLDKAYESPCTNKYDWCGNQISSWKQTYPDICSGTYTVNNEMITQICKKSCGLC